MLRVVCANPRCQKVLRIRPSQAGTRIRCPACRAALIAPQADGSAAAGPFDNLAAEDVAVDAPRPAWMTFAFYLGMLAGLFATVLLVVAFEVWLFLDGRTINKGPTADLLASGPWKIAGPKGRRLPKTQDGPVWSSKDSIWTFHPNGRAETGRLMEGRNRYERAAANGFRTWSWTAEGEVLTMTFKQKNKEEIVKFTVTDLTNDKLALMAVKQPGTEEVEDALDPTPLALEKVTPVETFPGWRIVFYAGVLAPMLVTLLLSWLISREVFHGGCLRFALAWPLTVLLGLALGAGAGFLMDMLNDHSHGELAYWMLLSFAQGALGVLMGFGLAVLSCLRPY